MAGSEISSTSEHVSPAVLDALAAGRKIEAIKLVREEQGIGLKEAKQLVESMEVKTATIRRAPPGTEGGGLRLLVVLIVGAALAALYYLTF